MDDEKVNEYLNKVPLEIRQSIKELNNDRNWAIYLAVTFGGCKSFSDLQKEFAANSNEITRALTSLREGGLVIKRIENMAKIREHDKYLYYSTAHGRKLLTCLFDIVPTKGAISSKPCIVHYRDVSSSIKNQKPQDFIQMASGSRGSTDLHIGQRIHVGGVING